MTRTIPDILTLTNYWLYSGVDEVFVDLTKKMLDTVKPSHRSRSSLATASSSMANAMNAKKADERIDLSQKIDEPSRCC